MAIDKQVNGGREGRPIGAYELAKAVEELGAGEILLNCIDCDGKLIVCNICLVIYPTWKVIKLTFFSCFKSMLVDCSPWFYTMFISYM